MPVKIWDFATRTFHWLLVVAVFVCFFTGEDEGFVFVIHAYAGFVVFVLLVFRTGWGIFGSPRSRFSDFTYSWKQVTGYASALLRFKPIHHIGHNPLGGLMIFAMLAVLATTLATGFAMVVAKFAWLEDIHEVLGTAMQILVGLHIAGVIVDQLLTGDNLIRAMVSGTKELTAEDASRERPLVPTWSAAMFALAVLSAGVFAHEKMDFTAAVSAFAATEQERNTDHD